MNRTLVLVLAAALVAGGCGKMGPPRPTIQPLPAAAKNLSLRQIGNDVVIGATLPSQRADGTPIGDDAEVHILRSPATDALKPGAISNRYLRREFMRRAQPVAVLTGESLRHAAPGGRLIHGDADVGAAATAGAVSRFLYSVLVIDAAGKGSMLPVPLSIAFGTPPPAPADLRAEVAEGEIRLNWRSAEEPEEVQFNIYRRPAGEERIPELPLNGRPTGSTDYVDTTFRYGETYFYTVRTVAPVELRLRESADTATYEIRPLDRFPPAAPTGLAVAAEGRAIRLYWFPNAEPDLTGYRIYRAEAMTTSRTAEGAGPAAGLGETPDRIGEVVATETTFTDSAAVPGVRYHYSVSAIDDASPPNESARSEERSEMMPVDPAQPRAGTPGTEESE